MFVQKIKSYVIKLINWRYIFLIRKSTENIQGVHQATFFGKPIINQYPSSTIKLWKKFIGISSNKYNPVWISHCLKISTLSESAIIEIWDDVWISGASICAKKWIFIWNWVLIGANVTIIDNDFHPIHSLKRRYKALWSSDYKEVIIEDNVFIWMNSIILKWSHIKENSVIGAGSVVSGVVDMNTIYAWNPAKEIGKLKI